MKDAITQPGFKSENLKDPAQPILLILNAGSGKKNAEKVANQLASVFDEAQQPYQFFLCRRPSALPEMTKLAITQAAQENGVVVAAGGDGTISFVAKETLASGLRFGVIPLGTFNYFARDNDIPQEVTLAAKTVMAGLREGFERPIQVGLLNDEVFLVNASLGLYPQLLVDRETFKQKHGRSRLVAKLSGLVSLFKRDIKMLLRVKSNADHHTNDENIVHASTIFVGNNALQLKEVGLTPESQQVQEGQLAVVRLPPMTAQDRVSVALHGLARMLGDAQNVEHFSCRQLEVEPLKRRKKYIKVAMDGEVSKMRAPLTFRVGAKPLRLVVPQSFGEDA